MICVSFVLITNNTFLPLSDDDEFGVTPSLFLSRFNSKSCPSNFDGTDDCL